MNENHLQSIFRNYIDKFEEINTKYTEYYKWQVAFKFHTLMDEALDGPLEEFVQRLKEAKKVTYNLIDSYTTPFYGLIKYAEKNNGAAMEVRNMFDELLRKGSHDVSDKQLRADLFLSKSLEIQQREFPDSYLFKNDFHSVTGYMFLYDPDHNYFFKSSHASRFADCIEFYDDWGEGTSVKLAVYYRMCDWLIKKINESPELISTNNYRFQNLWNNPSEKMHPDDNKHILAFDIIYCCANYGLFDGITFSKLKLKERNVLLEKRKKASEYAIILDKAIEDKKRFDKAIEYINSICLPGAKVNSAKYGRGTIIQNEKSGSILVGFDNGEEHLLGITVVLRNNIISIEDETFTAWLNNNKQVLIDEKRIRDKLLFAEKQFEPYSDYLD